MTSSVMTIVLNWNNVTDTLACLGSLEQSDYPNHRVLVVDNGSTDGSVQAIRERYPDVLMRETGRNLGYAGGNNVGIRYALKDGANYVCILNNDTTVAPGFMSLLLKALESRDEAGVVIPLIADMVDPDRVWALGAAVDRTRGEITRLHAGESVSALHTKEPFEVDIAPGTAMLVKREVFERVGLLDEKFFLFYEEADWCLPVRQSGYQIVAVPSSVIWHKVTAALGQTSPAVDYYMLRNRLFFIGRHWAGPARWYLLGRAVVRNLLAIAAYTAKPRGGRRLPHRNARLLALRDAALGRWGEMGADVAAACRPDRG